MSAPFKVVPLKPQSFIQKVFNRLPKANAIAELTNLCAEQEISALTHDQIAGIELKYKVRMARAFPKDLLNLYRQYLEFCFVDRKLSDNEISDLAHLKGVFSLKDPQIAQVHDDVIRSIYSSEVSKVLQDGRLEDSERTFLDRLRSDIGLSAEVASQIYSQSAEKLLQNFLDGVVSDQRISPDEENQLTALSNSLGINIKMDTVTRQAFEKYKLYWQIENGNPPVVDAGINLQRNESCYFLANIDWLEQRKVTRRINYGGPTLRIKIAKGFYWRAGSMNVQAVSDDVWKVIDSGKLFITNKRLVFMGSRGNKTVRLSSILDFTPYRNGVDIEKDSGKSPFLRFDNNVDLFSMILGRAIKDLN